MRVVGIDAAVVRILAELPGALFFYPICLPRNLVCRNRLGDRTERRFFLQMELSQFLTLATLLPTPLTAAGN